VTPGSAAPPAETLGPVDRRPDPVQLRCPVLAAEPAAAYRRIVLDAGEAARRALPGQFVALAVGEPPTAMLLRRAVSIHRARAVDDRFGGAGTIEIVVAPHGPGTQWLTRCRPGDTLDVVGPLGRPFPVFASGEAHPAVVVGGGYGSAPLLWLAEELTGDVDVVLGAATADRLFGVGEAEALVGSSRTWVTTDDGSAGEHGRVSLVLERLLSRQLESAPAVDVYACGPMAMLRAVQELAAPAGARTWLAVEESMACGIGICMTCVLPVRGEDGVTRMTRSCLEGPTFDGERIRWDAIAFGPGGAHSAVPEDCLGAPQASGTGH